MARFWHVFLRDERSERALALTWDILHANEGHYTVWYGHR